ncbi:spore coat protein [Bacillus swezeyi]|uniref:Spore coat protein n=1 Tax=Bacillus swezeyi TaxID=1925020 RepID=A0A1R1QBR6_9BACI|nr:spore coat protein [Bacillus swezeyi]MEC1261501.1 spore coat protein [Bacillus swezeyi]MED1739179.1 spore coat protein [Bacillus swezeyi]MED2926636.1 spore coat protein [Bacillus swezeyi]MED2944107.1 spore coat protein [Bacillus swezeyi]MED2965802.1 spore coat protein [Bacillus swezeyi]
MEPRPYSWVALDPECEHPGTEHYPRFPKKQLCDDYSCKCGKDEAFINQELDQLNLNKQLSDETIIIKDSCDIRVSTEDTQVVTSVLTSIQTAIVTVVLAIIDDADLAELVSQDLLQVTANKQANRQKLVIDNSRDVTVTTEDTDVATLVSTAVQTLTVVIATLIVGIL